MAVGLGNNSNFDPNWNIVTGGGNTGTPTTTGTATTQTTKDGYVTSGSGYVTTGTQTTVPTTSSRPVLLPPDPNAAKANPLQQAAEFKPVPRMSLSMAMSNFSSLPPEEKYSENFTSTFAFLLKGAVLQENLTPEEKAELMNAHYASTPPTSPKLQKIFEQLQKQAKAQVQLNFNLPASFTPTPRHESMEQATSGSFDENFEKMLDAAVQEKKLNPDEAAKLKQAHYTSKPPPIADFKLHSLFTQFETKAAENVRMEFNLPDAYTPKANLTLVKENLAASYDSNFEKAVSEKEESGIWTPEEASKAREFHYHPEIPANPEDKNLSAEVAMMQHNAMTEALNQNGLPPDQTTIPVLPDTEVFEATKKANFAVLFNDALDAIKPPLTDSQKAMVRDIASGKAQAPEGGGKPNLGAIATTIANEIRSALFLPQNVKPDFNISPFLIHLDPRQVAMIQAGIKSIQEVLEIMGEVVLRIPEPLRGALMNYMMSISDLLQMLKTFLYTLQTSDSRVARKFIKAKKDNMMDQIKRKSKEIEEMAAKMEKARTMNSPSMKAIMVLMFIMVAPLMGPLMMPFIVMMGPLMAALGPVGMAAMSAGMAGSSGIGCMVSTAVIGGLQSTNLFTKAFAAIDKSMGKTSEAAKALKIILFMCVASISMSAFTLHAPLVNSICTSTGDSKETADRINQGIQMGIMVLMILLSLGAGVVGGTAAGAGVAVVNTGIAAGGQATAEAITTVAAQTTAQAITTVAAQTTAEAITTVTAQTTAEAVSTVTATIATQVMEGSTRFLDLSKQLATFLGKELLNMIDDFVSNVKDVCKALMNPELLMDAGRSGMQVAVQKAINFGKDLLARLEKIGDAAQDLIDMLKELIKKLETMLNSIKGGSATKDAASGVTETSVSANVAKAPQEFVDMCMKNREFFMHVSEWMVDHANDIIKYFELTQNLLQVAKSGVDAGKAFNEAQMALIKADYDAFYERSKKIIEILNLTTNHLLDGLTPTVDFIKSLEDLQAKLIKQQSQTLDQLYSG